MRGARQRELQLLRAATFEALLEALTEGLRASYDLAYCSLVLCDPDNDIRHLLLATARRRRVSIICSWWNRSVAWRRST